MLWRRVFRLNEEDLLLFCRLYDQFKTIVDETGVQAKSAIRKTPKTKIIHKDY